MLPPEAVARAIREIGIGFLFAPLVHTAMKHAHPVRVELKMRTVFNLLGPLTNPAGATAQLAGAPSEHAAELMAGALAQLGLERGYVVHGSDGMDEITTIGPTTVTELKNGELNEFTIIASDYGIREAHPEDIVGGDAGRNARILTDVIDGEKGACRDIVLLNAGAAIYTAGKACSIREGIDAAVVSIDSGNAGERLASLIELAGEPQ
jgi:anthranilate phosphoribosyltransferase